MKEFTYTLKQKLGQFTLLYLLRSGFRNFRAGVYQKFRFFDRTKPEAKQCQVEGFVIEKDQNVLVKSGPENRKPIRNGYIIPNSMISVLSSRPFYREERNKPAAELFI